MGNKKPEMIGSYLPTFNRCIIFETNENSYHGHPKPLQTPPHITRKSMATYYYTSTTSTIQIAEEHNTVFVNTQGLAGQVRRFKSGIKALIERIFK